MATCVASRAKHTNSIVLSLSEELCAMPFGFSADNAHVRAKTGRNLLASG